MGETLGINMKVEILADSINAETGDRLTAFLATFPRVILAEINTHRALSRNSASSRARPFKTVVKEVMKDPFIPIGFQEDHKGMQGTKYLSGFKLKIAKFLWLRGRDLAVISAIFLSKIGVTKQLCNRILEPFLWHTAILSGTEWENFFALRAHDAAEIHLQKLAYLMLEEYNKSIPIVRYPIEINQVDGEYSVEQFLEANPNLDWHLIFQDKMPEGLTKFEQLKVCSSRAARVSYLTFDNKLDINKDFEIFGKLIETPPLHASPVEYAAFPIKESKFVGNLKGWFCFRKLFSNENAADPRVIKRRVVNGKVI